MVANFFTQCQCHKHSGRFLYVCYCLFCSQKLIIFNFFLWGKNLYWTPCRYDSQKKNSYLEMKSNFTLTLCNNFILPELSWYERGVRICTFIVRQLNALTWIAISAPSTPESRIKSCLKENENVTLFEKM